MYTFHIVTHPDWGVGYGARQLEQLKGFKAWGANPTDNIEDSGGVKKIDNMTNPAHHRRRAGALLGEPESHAAHAQAHL